MRATPCTAAILVACGHAAGQTCTPSWPQRFAPTPIVGTIFDSAVYDPGDGAGLYFVGVHSVESTLFNAIARYRNGGWSPLGQGLSNGRSLTVHRPAQSSPALLYVLGDAISLPSSTYVASWNGQTWSAAAGNSGVLAFHSGGYSHPTRFFALHLGPALTPVLLIGQFFSENSIFSGYSSGTLWQLGGTSWFQPATNGIGGSPSSATAFDPDGPGPEPEAIYTTAIGTWRNTKKGVPPPNSGHSSSIASIHSGVAHTLFETTTGYFESLCTFDPPGPQPSSLYVGGAFTTPGTPGGVSVARVEGTQLVPIAIGYSGIAGLKVLDEDGPGPRPPAMYAFGRFSTIDGIPANSIARYDGNAWTALGPGVVASGTNSLPIRTLSTFDEDGPGPRPTALYAAGEFDTAGAFRSPRIARWTGQNWTPLGPVPDNFIHAVLPADLGSGPALYLGGRFTSAAGLPAVGIASWDGSQFSQLGAGMNNHVNALARLGPDVIAAGRFTAAGSVLAARIARWNGSAWHPLGAGLNDEALALAVSGPSLFVAGRFTAAGGAPAARIARWDGAAWSALGSGLNGDVAALAIHQNNLFAAGSFTAAGGAPAPGLARWDGNTWHALDPGFPVSALISLHGHLFAAGASGQEARLSAWNGVSWFSLPSLVRTGGPASITAMSVIDEDGTGPASPVLYVSGAFDASPSGAPLNRFARWDGIVWSAPPQGLDAPALAIAQDAASGHLWLGGGFTRAGGQDSYFLAALDPCLPACQANCDGSTVAPSLNVADFTCFLNAFASGNPYANCDASTTHPVLNVADFSCYMARFGAGCP